MQLLGGLVTVCTVLCLVAQSCLTLCDLMDCSPPGFSVHGDSPDENTGGAKCTSFFMKLPKAVF